MIVEEKYMQRCFELAYRGQGKARPNPMVGAVIVHKDKIIAEGYHTEYGKPHAEVEAIRKVEDASILRECTLYVNLEPCHHYGKTPPCTKLILETGIPRVVISNTDPNPLVSGKGIHALREYGVEVATDVLTAEGMWLNRRFFHFHVHKRPYIVLKWAQTNDGYIARLDGIRQWISSDYARRHVHMWRAQEAGIWIGMNTLRADNPRLDVREVVGTSPTRIVYTKGSDLPANVHFDTLDTNFYVFHSQKTLLQPSANYIYIHEDTYPQEMVNQLYKLSVQSVMVEGGAQLINRLVKDGLWDEARVFVSSTSFGSGIEAPLLKQCVEIHNSAVASDHLRISISSKHLFNDYCNRSIEIFQNSLHKWL